MSNTECNNCLCHLKICKAECCKRFSFNITEQNKKLIQKNKVVRFTVPMLNADLSHYFKLHGCKIVGGDILVHCHNYNILEDKIIFNHRCLALTKQNKCSLQGLDSQPRICAYPNIRGETHNQVVVTPRCLYRGLYGKEEKEKI